jgi:hypothetical protein
MVQRQKQRGRAMVCAASARTPPVLVAVRNRWTDGSSVFSLVIGLSVSFTNPIADPLGSVNAGH